MAINFPTLDTRDEDEVTASVVDALPAEITNRNPASIEVKLVEACGAFYGLVLYALEQYPKRLLLKMLDLLGIDQEAATFATVTLTFTASTGGTIPAGTEVKTGAGVDAIVFTTDSELVLGASGSDQVTATAAVAGASGNVSAGTLTTFDPITGIDSVTNNAAAINGSDEEALDEMIERAPLSMRAGERAVTDSDFEGFALSNANVERADAVGSYGVTTVHLIMNDLNERYFDDNFNATDAAIRTAVRADLLSRTLGGVDVVITQTDYRLFAVTDIEVELLSGYTIAGTKDAIQEALARAVTAFALYDTDGSQVSPQWIYSEPVYRNELISAVDRVEGVRRVGDLKYATSDDFGNTWTTPAIMPASVAAAANGGDTANAYALLHWGGPQPVDSAGDLFHSGLPSAGWYSGYTLTVVEL